ncbi:hypothetical protein Ahy_A09g043118 isoform C [Arachis hypogaea]|uniref:Uncharacterized protein n=1 Tax=Arachis hypogaea TaxID=3818 RepID=A0A445BHJ9_ARAHY|nr:hypothetical protein Ahy_A09g043118 isoform C [Arachis hypogaea]
MILLKKIEAVGFISLRIGFLYQVFFPLLQGVFTFGICLL